MTLPQVHYNNQLSLGYSDNLQIKNYYKTLDHYLLLSEF